jgi:hypothetical protein
MRTCKSLREGKFDSSDSGKGFPIGKLQLRGIHVAYGQQSMVTYASTCVRTFFFPFAISCARARLVCSC